MLTLTLGAFLHLEAALMRQAGEAGRDEYKRVAQRLYRLRKRAREMLGEGVVGPVPRGRPPREFSALAVAQKINALRGVEVEEPCPSRRRDSSA